MSQKVMQQALEALEWNYNTDLDNIPACEQWAKMLNETITALKQALAELDSDYERGFVDGMNLQTKRSVDKAVNRMAQTTHWEGCEAVHPECRKPEQEPVAWIQKTAVDWLTTTSSNAYIITTVMKNTDDEAYVPLYTAPTPRKPLTDEEIINIGKEARAVAGPHILPVSFARAIERAHGIGEQQ